ncbi:TonB-dependent receptor [Prolixibacter sp. SD074]|uniref:TonB-dependent receptor n=1 Tax=Prolixibacter sp. SD074 TaxID=2652391 RepID=UPI0012736350|nr:TonB-dependent receptor [Prolixibacter sp. SD074]GET29802.1 hypothetical protein SD074_20040 [Prolixibacter sp. SD074]
MKHQNISLSIFLTAAIGLGSAATIFAQKQDTTINKQVEVVKAYRPSVSDAYKISPMPEIDDTTHFRPQFDYHIDSEPVTTGFKTVPVSAAAINLHESTENGYGYLKLGMGTYNTPYGEFFFNQPKGKNSMFGAHYRHLSSTGRVKLNSSGEKVDAPYSHNNLEIFGKYFFRKSVFSVNLNYDRNVVKFYGYPDSIPAYIKNNGYGYFNDKQRMQNWRFNVGLKSSQNSRSELQYKAGLHYSNFTTKTRQTENNAGMIAGFDNDFGNLHGLLESSLDYYSTDGIDNFDNPASFKRNSIWFKLNPSVLLRGDAWKIRAGLNTWSVSDDDRNAIFKVYPKLDIELKPVGNIMTLYIGADGFLQNNNYSAIAKENPWANPRHDIRNTDYKYIVFGGFKGKISPQISYKAGVKYSKAHNMHFFVTNAYPTVLNPTYPIATNEWLYRNDFDVEYDDAGILNLNAEVSYFSGSDYYLQIKANYYSYTLDSLNVASYKPNFDATVSSGVRFTQRLTGFIDMNITGNRKAIILYQYNPMSSARPSPYRETVSLDPIVNMNLGAEYELPYRLKLFSRLDNVFNQHYDRWLGYTSQGMRFMVGASWSF